MGDVRHSVSRRQPRSIVLFAAALVALGAMMWAAGCNDLEGIRGGELSGPTGVGGGTTTQGGGGAQGGGGTTSQGGGGNGSGGGTGCVDAVTDCPAPSGECKKAVCDADGSCVEADIDDGNLAGTQTDGDCKKSVCQGGAVGSENDDTDPFDDGNDCTIDTCDMGSPTTGVTGAGSACMVTKVCDGLGVCVECVDPTDCTDPLKPVCNQNACVSAACSNNVKDANETDKDCGGACAPCDDGKVCVDAGDCASGVCTGLVCQIPSCGDNVQNGVETDKDCGGNGGCPKCKATQGCNDATDCLGNQCSGVGGTCTPNCSDTDKNGAETDVDCGGGTCGTCAVGKECAGVDGNCAANAFCNVMSKCAADLPLGGACMGTSQCASGFCTDGVCCNSGCGALCQACNNAGGAGTCASVPSGQDPASECAGADVCNGSGACTKALGTACGAGGECTSGNCIDGVCCDTSCAGNCKACSMVKTGGANGTCANVATNTDPDNECPGSLTCAAGGVCASPQAQGAMCTVGGECASGSCVDGFCCANTCTATCKACSMVKTGSANGTCANITINTDPDNDCVGVTTCNGSGACSQQPNGAACTQTTECTSGFCVDGVCCSGDCQGVCRECSGVHGGTAGTCFLLPAGTDFENDCNGVAPLDLCNGGGSCGLGNIGNKCVGVVGVCANGNCTNGVCP